MAVMDQKQFATRLALQARLTQGQAEDVVNALGVVIVRELQRGHAVALDGFGFFDKAEREDGSQALRFRQANKVKEALNED